MDSKLFMNEKTLMKYNLKLKLGINYEFCETEDISFENENNLHRFLLRFCSVCRIPLFSFFASVLLRFALIAYLNSGINILYLLFFIYRYVFTCLEISHSDQTTQVQCQNVIKLEINIWSTTIFYSKIKFIQTLFLPWHVVSTQLIERFYKSYL